MPDQSRLVLLSCHSGCRADTARRAHHDRLLAVETDADAVVELFDVAVTWHELEYDDEEMVAPHRWAEFARRHRWQDPTRVERIFALATDVALRARPAAPAVPLSRASGMASGSDICEALAPARPHLALAHG